MESRNLCHISYQKQIEKFVANYKQRTGEALKLKLKKPSTPESIYEVRSNIAVITIPDMKKQEMLKEFSLNILQSVFKIQIQSL